MQIEELTIDKIREILREVKQLFQDNLGQYTHKRVTDDWYYHSLAFTHKDMGYLFGFNIGLFKKGPDYYDHIGMNIVIRSDGQDPVRRKKFQAFFRENLKDWINQPEYCYIQSERGGEGVIFPRYRKICKYDKQEDLVNFLRDAINELQPVYLKILENPDNLFDKVVRAAPGWSEGILNLCKEHIEK